MTAPETSGSNGSRIPLERERSYILEVYRVHLDIWKVQNENYFKRVQLLMLAIQAALFAAALEVFINVEGESFDKVLILTSIAGLGMISSAGWITLHDKQNHYLEYCRRTLRNLEHKLSTLGVPLRYFTLEAHVFGPLREEGSILAGIAIGRDGNRDFAHFAWSNERYPDKDMEGKKANRDHQLAQVGGGMKSFERNMALFLLVLWALMLTLTAFCPYLKEICLRLNLISGYCQ
ncbi:MAG: hypothetical protein HPY65_00795 [Syntrophaceae bacterium]|nr:hypothetical protein [Syntrophaceae bacterium]